MYYDNVGKDKSLLMYGINTYMFIFLPFNISNGKQMAEYRTLIVHKFSLMECYLPRHFISKYVEIFALCLHFLAYFSISFNCFLL